MRRLKKSSMITLDVGPMPTECVICGGDGYEAFDKPLPARVINGFEFPEVKGMCGFELCHTCLGSHCFKCPPCKEGVTS